MRYLSLGSIVLLLAGCALPLPLQLASWAISGISYVKTGKSISDHVISAVASRDCALHRIALGEDVCFPGALDDSDIAVASKDGAEDMPLDVATDDTSTAMRLRESMIVLAKSLDQDSISAELDADDAIAVNTSEQLDTVLLAMAETLIDIDIAPASSSDIAPASGPDKTPIPVYGSDQHYLIIGSYRQMKDAEQAQSRHAPLPTTVRMVLREGALLYQVTAGPFNRPDALEIGAGLTPSESGLPRVALLCADRASTPPCAKKEIPVQLTTHLVRE